MPETFPKTCQKEGSRTFPLSKSISKLCSQKSQANAFLMTGVEFGLCSLNALFFF